MASNSTKLSSYSSLMVQGTTSDAGKSVLVAGLCRVLQRLGVDVAPFKPQNMALNSAVTPEGGEIGRAQAVQARAAKLTPHVDMNPILLKPCSDTGAQVIVQGKAVGNMQAIGFKDYKSFALPKVLDSFSRLTSRHQCVVVEGAGSPAEVNLRENDIANMGFAEEADVPVIIIADIDKGGVFAHLYGTLALLSPSEQERVKGFVINRFRGDIGLLESGLEWLEKKTGKPVIGVLPYLHGFNLEAEDALVEQPESDNTNRIKVLVPVLPRISNHTDFDPLRLHPDIDFQYIGKGGSLEGADLIILPGTKSVRADLSFLKQQGWDKQIQRHLRYGGKIIGICGGYQILGQEIEDPTGVEGEIGQTQGLQLLEQRTLLKNEKTLVNVTGTLTLDDKSIPVRGYEIHVGETSGKEHAPIVLKSGNLDGAISADNQIFGTYLHGLFDQPAVTAALISWATGESIASIDHDEVQELAINQIADAIEQHLDLSLLWSHYTNPLYIGRENSVAY
ncbi:cobyric acid synthase [Vibrio sp. FNV 38]|nr:cobyric acid synthase [Vibrio sp. FNV 38]